MNLYLENELAFKAAIVDIRNKLEKNKEIEELKRSTSTLEMIACFLAGMIIAIML